MSIVVSAPILSGKNEIKITQEEWQQKYEALMAAFREIATSPSTAMLMTQPVVLSACGHTVEQNTIQNQKCCPVCVPAVEHHNKFVVNFFANDIIILLKECEKSEDKENIAPQKKEETDPKNTDWQKKYKHLTDKIKEIANCPVFQEIMCEPVALTTCGHTFEAETLTMLHDQICPTCRSPIANNQGYTRNYFAKDLINALTRHEPKSAEEQHISLPILHDILAEAHANKSNLPSSLTPILCHKKTTTEKEANELLFLNKIYQEGIYKDQSALFILAFYHEGQQYLAAAKINMLIAEETLNHIIQEGPNKGQSPAFWFSFYPQGRILLTKEPIKSMINTEALNSIVQEGSNIGETMLYWLAYYNIKLLAEPQMKSKIRMDGLNALIPSGPEQGKSALYWLARSPEGRKLLADPEIKGKIGELALNFITRHGETALFFLALYPEGRMLLADPDIKRKIGPALNAIIKIGCYTDQSALFCLAGTSEGRKLLAEPEIKCIINPQALNSIIQQGPQQGESALLWLSASPTWRKILAEAEFTKMISAETFNTVIQAGPFKGKSAADFFKNTPDGQLLLQNNPDLKAKILNVTEAIASPSVVLATAVPQEANEDDHGEQRPVKKHRP